MVVLRHEEGSQEISLEKLGRAKAQGFERIMWTPGMVQLSLACSLRATVCQRLNNRCSGPLRFPSACEEHVQALKMAVCEGSLKSILF